MEKHDRSAINRKVLRSTCTEHPSVRGFTNLVMTRRDRVIVLDPHATGCVIELDEAEATALRDTLTEWLGH